MLNQVILVGRVNKIDKDAGIVTIEIKRPNQEESDKIPVTLDEKLIASVSDYLNEGSTIGVKASLNIKDGILRILGEKLTFINAKNE